MFLRLVVKVGGGSIVLAGLPEEEAGSLSGSVMAWPWVASTQTWELARVAHRIDIARSFMHQQERPKKWDREPAQEGNSKA